MEQVYPLRVLGFESYDTGSHRSVREQISRHSRHEWTWFARPGRGWKWRMRLAAVELLDEAGRAGCLDEAHRPQIDAIFATSLMGAADLRALLPAHLRAVPLILYMHENQAAYPMSGSPRVDPKRDVHFAITNLTSVLAADLVIWNSEWNRRSFAEGMEAILRRANAVELDCWQERMDERSRVIWPPVEDPPDGGAAPEVLHNSGGAGPVRVVWPHRWEHDKGPDELLELAGRDGDRLDLRWTVLGWQYPTVPEALVELGRRHAARIDHMGHEPDRARYWAHLRRADWVLSTARHEYFGIAVVEALLAGCLPWLPDRLSYPEILPDEARGLSPARPPADPQRIVELVRAHLEPARAPNAVRRIDDAIEGLLPRPARTGR